MLRLEAVAFESTFEPAVMIGTYEANASPPHRTHRLTITTGHNHKNQTHRSACIRWNVRAHKQAAKHHPQSSHFPGIAHCRWEGAF